MVTRVVIDPTILHKANKTTPGWNALLTTYQNCSYIEAGIHNTQDQHNNKELQITLKHPIVFKHPAELTAVEKNALLTSHPTRTLFREKAPYPVADNSYSIVLTVPTIKRKRLNTKENHGERLEPLNQLIGNGSFGRVIKNNGAIAIDDTETAAKQRVIKYIQRFKNEDITAFKQRIYNEYTLLSLNSTTFKPKPVVFDDEHNPTAAFLTMAEVGEESLLNHLFTYNPNLNKWQPKPLTKEQRRDLSIVVPEAIEALINKGIIHRDLKLSNIMIRYINGKYQAWVVDLGAGTLAQTEKESPSQTLVGSLSYSAPEVLDEYQYSHASDIFSAGKILSEIWGAPHPTANTTLSRKALHEAT
ncbi:MAG: protein kinase domain-containing protein, partial [Gammaproteobacteria bacterium]